ncbi:MAG: hypothetical protein Kapaf2KO_18390 [Candidatus Kapaibacteriales bacterium]
MKMKRIIIPLLAVIAAGSILAYASIDSDEKNNTSDLAMAATSTSGAIYSVESVEKPAKGSAPDFTWKDEKGKSVSFSEYSKNKVVFLNFWGTWCPPCRKEIPDIVRISKELKDKDFVIMGVALERGNSPEDKLKKYMNSQGITYHNFLQNERELSQAYGGITSVPTTFIINKEGQIVEKIVGMRSYEAFMTSINKVL